MKYKKNVPGSDNIKHLAGNSRVLGLNDANEQGGVVTYLVSTLISDVRNDQNCIIGGFYSDI